MPSDNTVAMLTEGDRAPRDGACNARDHGLVGDGETNDQPAFAALVEAPGAKLACDGRARVIYCPPGVAAGSPGRSVSRMTMIGRATPTGEWEIDRLDLDAYLERVGYAGALAADAATLRGLHRAHAAAIPFENLDIVLGRTIELDLDSVQDKLVRRPRGGYCFEHNTLFAAVLERLGYAVTRLSARVDPSRPGPRTHMALRVVADGSPWLADVGFGASLLEPLPLQPATATQGGWRYRLAATGSDAWLLQADEADGWSDLYAFTLEPQRPIDYEVYNHYTATHPRSRFVGQLVALRTEPDVRHALRGAQFTTTRPDGATDERRIDVAEVPDLLAARFGIGLTPEEAARLRQAVKR